MRASNRLILVALLVTLLSLVEYDLRLKTAYESGNYKIPFSDYIALPWKDFDIVDLNASTAANVKFVQGPFSVRIDERALDYVVIHQQANRLQIDARFKGSYLFNRNPYILIVSCPRLSALYTDATYRANDHQVTDTIVREDWNMRQVLIDGFRQDSLSVIQDYGSTVVLSNNIIRSFHASIGESKGAGPKLMLQSSNQFQDADLIIGQKSKFQLENALIPNLSYQLADSAQLILNGNAQGLFYHSKIHQK